MRCFYGINNIHTVQPELSVFSYSLQTIGSGDILAYIIAGRGKKNQPALFVPFPAFRHNGNVDMLNTHSLLSVGLASPFVVIRRLGEGSPRLRQEGLHANASSQAGPVGIPRHATSMCILLKTCPAQSLHYDYNDLQLSFRKECWAFDNMGRFKESLPEVQDTRVTLLNPFYEAFNPTWF